MTGDYVIACALIWRSTADDDAAQELLCALESADSNLKAIAEAFLVECGEESMWLLEDAVAEGCLSPAFAGPCMAEILRRQLHGEPPRTVRWLVADASQC